MTPNGIVGIAGACALAAVLGQPAWLGAQAGSAPKAQTAAAEKKAAPSSAALGSVHIPRKVTADGQALPAGTYSLRLSDAAVKPVVGQTPAQAKWVEFVQGGAVKGREIATVLTSADAKAIAKQGLPASGGTKVEALKGNDYLRVWVNKGGTNYLIHLGSATM